MSYEDEEARIGIIVWLIVVIGLPLVILSLAWGGLVYHPPVPACELSTAGILGCP